MKGNDHIGRTHFPLNHDSGIFRVDFRSPTTGAAVNFKGRSFHLQPWEIGFIWGAGHLYNQNLSIHFTLLYFKKKIRFITQKSHTNTNPNPCGTLKMGRSCDHWIPAFLKICRTSAWKRPVPTPFIIRRFQGKGGRNGVRAGRYKLQRGEVTNPDQFWCFFLRQSWWCLQLMFSFCQVWV